jgi:hypothetical protein
MDCVTKETQRSTEWLEMLRRFRSGRPRQGESFSVVRQVLEKDGAFFALESVGSTYVSARLSIAKRFESEQEARAELGV